jgi:G3E family GTPase
VIPITLVSGFLGSGKSTLIARLVRQPGFARTAVIVNEFGEVGIDHALLSRGKEDDIVLLDSGCICCTMTSSLEDTLETLYYKRQSEGLDFDRVVIETTGIADPGPIAQALAGGMYLSRLYHFQSLVVTVDAVHGSEQLEHHEENRRQVAMADRLLLTKADIAQPQALERTRAAIRAMNPLAPVLSVVQGVIDPLRVIAPSRLCRHEIDAGTASQEANDHHPDYDHGDEHAGEHAHESGFAHAYTTASARIPGAVSWERYAAWLEMLRSELGTSLLRAKGVLRFDDGELRAVQGVQLLFSPPAAIEESVAGDLEGAVVLIAHGVEPARLQACIRALGAAASATVI